MALRPKCQTKFSDYAGKPYSIGISANGEMNTIIATSITSSVMSAVFSAIIAQKMDETGNAIWLFLAILIGAFALAALVV